MAKLWKYREELDARALSAIDRLADGCGVSPELARLLWLRGVHSIGDGGVFLDSGLRFLERPERWPGMAEAATALFQKLSAGGTLAI